MTQSSSNFRGTMQGAPQLEASNTGYGPGPLSPFWGPARSWTDIDTPQTVEPVAPRLNEWAALGEEFAALRRACFLSLREETPGGQYLLSLRERDDLNAKLRRLQAGNLTLREYHRSRDVAAWPDPVLPSNRLWGARDLAELLGTAVRLAATLSERLPIEERNP